MRRYSLYEYIAELHDAIRVAIPLLVDLLKNEDLRQVSSAAVALGKLSENCGF
jgi:hypothetical protein